jgi:hypothetical protein
MTVREIVSTNMKLEFLAIPLLPIRRSVRVAAINLRTSNPVNESALANTKRPTKIEQEIGVKA